MATVALATLLALLACQATAHAAVFNVTTTADHAPNGCTAGDCTLREAIAAANADAVADTITLPASATHYAIDDSQHGFSISHSVDIVGAGAASTIIDGGGGQNIAPGFGISDDNVTPTVVSIRKVTIEGIAAGANAPSAIELFGSLADTVNVVSTTISGSFVEGLNTGGGFINVIDSTITGNNISPLTSGVGAITLFSTTNLTVSGSTISGNTTGQSGAAISVGNGSPSSATTVDIRNSTISGNTAGGAVVVDGTSPGVAKFSYDTITGNTANGGQPVLLRNAGSGWTFKGTIITGNTGTNCGVGSGGSPATQGFNFDSGTSCGFTNVATDHQSTPLALGTLQDNGGPTFTQALPAGSSAIDAGGFAGCTAIGGATLATDQRGIARPQGAGCDSGAYELMVPVVTPPGGGGGGGGGGSHDSTPPSIRSASLSPRTFAVNTKGHAEKAVGAKRKKATPRGTKLRFTLSEAARALFTVQLLSPGRSVGHHCVKPTSKNRGAKRCTRLVTIGRFALAGRSGSNSHAFSGRIGRRSLAPGSYRLTLVATDAAHNRSRSKRLTFTIVRP